MKKISLVIKMFFYLIVFAVFFNACYAVGGITGLLLCHAKQHGGSIEHVPDELLAHISKFTEEHFALTHSQISGL